MGRSSLLWRLHPAAVSHLLLGLLLTPRIHPWPQVSMRRQGRMQGAFDSLELGDRITVFNPVLSRIIAVSGSSDASDERFAELVTLKGSIHRTPRLERNAEVRPCGSHRRTDRVGTCRTWMQVSGECCD